MPCAFPYACYLITTIEKRYPISMTTFLFFINDLQISDTTMVFNDSGVFLIY